MRVCGNPKWTSAPAIQFLEGPTAAFSCLGKLLEANAKVLVTHAAKNTLATEVTYVHVIPYSDACLFGACSSIGPRSSAAICYGKLR